MSHHGRGTFRFTRDDPMSTLAVTCAVFNVSLFDLEQRHHYCRRNHPGSPSSSQMEPTHFLQRSSPNTLLNTHRPTRILFVSKMSQSSYSPAASRSASRVDSENETRSRDSKHRASSTDTGITSVLSKTKVRHTTSLQLTHLHPLPPLHPRFGNVAPTMERDKRIAVEIANSRLTDEMFSHSISRRQSPDLGAIGVRDVVGFLADC